MIKILCSSKCTREELLSRVVPESAEVDAIVRDIIDNVVKNGDRALYDYALRFDKATLDTLEVSKEIIIPFSAEKGDGRDNVLERIYARLKI